MRYGEKKMKLIYIFSLPRSGSTLLQRILYRNNSVSTVPEPWIMLPLMEMFKPGHMYAEFEHRLFIRAFQDLRAQGIVASYVRSKIIRSAADAYYESVRNKAAYFLDKTPRYSIICEDIKRIYPESINIVLLRHPFESASSMIRTFGHGHWCLFRFRIDFFVGLRRLADFVIQHRTDPLVIIQQYRDVCRDPEFFYKEICTIAGIDPNDAADLDEKRLIGALGDPSGRQKFGSKVAEAEPNYTWSKEFNTFARRRWARKVLHNVGRARFEAIGYDYDLTLSALRASKYSVLREITDLPYIFLGTLHHVFMMFPVFMSLRNRFRDRKVLGVR